MRTSFVAAWAIVFQAALAGLSAQEPAPAPDGPRFLLAVAGRPKPVEAEVGAVPLLRRRISLDLEDQSIADALRAIKGQTGIEFVYRSEMPALSKRVTLRAENITVGAALTDILVDARTDVLLSGGRYLTLVPRDAVPPMANGSIVGRVTDAKTQAALGGATVVVEGTSRNATTGNDGRYRIADVAPGAYTVRARYIGYAPSSTSVTVNANQEATADFGLEKSAQRLDEVVTTGTVVPTEVKALPTPISVITADDIQQQNLQRVDQIFRGQVPGTIAWDPGWNDNVSTVTMRGASSLGTAGGAGSASSVKTFIDGVETSDQFSALAVIDPNSIDRIEITRGPEASTLYGAGSLNGVVQIFTKKGRLGLTRPEVTSKISAGGVGGVDGQSSVFQTDNALSVLGGSEKTSYSVAGAYRHVGEWIPAYSKTDWGVSTGGQTSQGPFTLSASARYGDKSFAWPWMKQLQSYSIFSKPPNEADYLRQQTYGLTASLQATRQWQHTLTLGYDQNYYGFNQTRPQFTTPADSFMYAYSRHEARTSLLYHTDLGLRLATNLTAIVTAGANYYSFDDVHYYTYGATRTIGNLDGTTLAARSPWTNTGYFGQMQVNVAERLFLTGGLRAERNDNFGVDFGTAWSPRVGATYVLGIGPATVKLRASYGESIRAPTPGQRDTYVTAYSVQLANPSLAPERQRGGDGGVEIYLGRASVGVTYYRQRALDLLQQLLIPTPVGTLPTYQYQNVGRVKNEGWEFEGHLPVGPVQLAGTFSITNSIVQALPPGYQAGEYQVGDRVNGVPHTSAGATLTYSPLPRTTMTASMTYIGDWIESDWIALYGYYDGSQPYRGSDRAYWIEYPSVTKFAVGVSQGLTNDVTAFVRAENVGNNLRPESTNISNPTPRSVLVGANIRY